MDWLWWLGGAFALGIVEILVLDVVVLMLMGGAAAAAIAAALGADVWLQVAVFAATSTLLTVFLRPWAMKVLDRSTPQVTSGVKSYVGRHATAVREITATGGQVKLGGELWTARLQDSTNGLYPPTPLPAGTDVIVVEISGATAIVVPAHAEVTQWNSQFDELTDGATATE